MCAELEHAPKAAVACHAAAKRAVEELHGVGGWVVSAGRIRIRWIVGLPFKAQIAQGRELGLGDFAQSDQDLVEFLL